MRNPEWWVLLGLFLLLLTPYPDRAGQALNRWTHRKTNKGGRTFRVTVEEKPYGHGEWMDVEADSMNAALAETFKRRTARKGGPTT